jgi:catechol 2,3-dioxygenase-like lactoylglutathione lyase family enzyme
MSAPTGLLRVQHVSLPMPADGLSAARRFWCDILGLTEIPRPPALPGPGLWLAIGDQEIHCYAERDAPELNARSHRHPCLQAPDVAALRAHLEAAGVPTEDDDGEIPGRPRFFAADPFANTIEFVEFRPDHW